MRVLVLGGNGFIGSHIVDELLKYGHEVRVFDRQPEQFRSPLSIVDYRFGSFDDMLIIAEALDGVDIVCHLISTTVPSTSNMDPVSDIQSNLVSTVQLLEQMRKSEVSRIMYLSSGGTVYGTPKVLPITENHDLNPICSYGIVKVAIEKYLHMYQELYGIKSVILRASNPYGPRQGHVGVQGIIGTFLRRAMDGKSLEIWGDGSVVRDYIYIDDLVELSLSVIEGEYEGIFNAGSGEGFSVNQVCGVLEEILGRKIEIIHKESRSLDVPEVVLDIQRARKEVGWTPRVKLKEGINRHYNWLQPIVSSDKV